MKRSKNTQMVSQFPSQNMNTTRREGGTYRGGAVAARTRTVLLVSPPQARTGSVVPDALSVTGRFFCLFEYDLGHAPLCGVGATK